MQLAILKGVSFVLCVMAYSFASGQQFEINSGNHFRVALGPAFPIGEFSNYDFQKGERGLAQPGFYIDASFAHNLKNKPFGYQAGFRFSSFSRDGEKLLGSHVPDGAQNLFTIKMGKYNMAGVYGGLFYDLVSKKKVNVRLSGHVGLSRVSYADHLFVTKDTPTITDAEDADAVLSLLYGTDVIFAYSLNERLRLGLNLGFFAGQAIYQITWSFRYSGGMSSGNETIKQPIAAINSGLVISYKLK